ncbi:phage major capsid protein [Candidatus Bathyarchaeota archaeon]|nr:phage major capsid protein [Candidatus Bathyarchaeota archaeon]
MNYDELKSKLLEDFKGEIIPGITEEFLEKPEMKKLFEEHSKLVAQGIEPKAQAEEEVPFAQTARFIRAIRSNDKKEIAEIQKEEKPKWERKNGLSTYLSEGDNVQGGYLVPVEYYSEIFRLICEYGIARRDCRIIPMNSSTLHLTTSAGLPTTYWIGEAEVKVESKPTFGRVTLEAVKQICLVVFTDELLADATPPIVQYIIEVVREVILRGEDDALFNGNGVGGGIAGVLSCGTAVIMDNNRQAFSQVHTDDLIRLVAAAACGSRKGGKFYFHYDTLTWLRELKTTTGAYILNESPVGDGPPTLWNKPYETSDVMPDNSNSAVNTPFIVFGDFKKTVAFGDRMTLTMKLADQATISGTNLFTYDMQALRFVERLDIECLLPLGITVLYTAP